MPLQTSGNLSITQITEEFAGDTAPHSLSEFYRGGSYVDDSDGANTADIPTSNTISISDFYGQGLSPQVGEAVFLTPGIHFWDVPDDVGNVCIIAISGGGGASGTPENSSSGANGGGGGGTFVGNAISTTPGETLEIRVGDVGLGGDIGVDDAGGTGGAQVGADGGDSVVIRSSDDVTMIQVKGGTGGQYEEDPTGYLTGSKGGYTTNSSGTSFGGAGGIGGEATTSYGGGGGGAGGFKYSGMNSSNNRGGNGAPRSNPGGSSTAGENGRGGSGGGGHGDNTSVCFNGGGGVGISAYSLTDGVGGTGQSNPATGGSGGGDGGAWRGVGGEYGGGGGGHKQGLSNSNSRTSLAGNGAQGAVRIIYGDGRAFPSTDASPASSNIIQSY